VLASVHSDHVVEVLDAGFDRGRLFYAMVDHGAGTLASHGARHSVGERVGFVADAGRGAHDLHEHGAAHRDIRPGTIAIDGSRARLFDVGLAQLLTPGLTTTGRGPVGTVEFLDPEVALGAKASRSSDVWSLGVTLHVAVSGRGVHPDLPTRNLGAALRHLVQRPPMLDEQLPGDVAEVVRTCLAPPTERFATAAELAASIDSILLVKGRL
jgi:serine/threonine protein kinase